MGEEHESNGPSHARQQAAARVLWELLVGYGREVERLRGGWEAVTYRAASDRFALMRGLMADLPGLRSEWIDLLITRFEFAQVLWDRRTHAGAALRLHEVQAKHAAAVRKLGVACEVLGFRTSEGIRLND